uniref:Uncharacterized protein n=1 Tax=Monodon monoceros TaxID=40151 RepID=A0A8C6AV31_MONMO
MRLQDFATNVLLRDHHTDVLLSSDILASHRSLSSSQREHASEDAPVFQVVPYDLNVSEQSSRGQQKFKTPQLQDPFKSQSEMSAPTEEWRDFKRPQPKEHEEMKSQREMLASSSQASGMSHASQVRERGESLGSKHPQLSPGKRQLSPESQKRMRQYVSHDKRGKGIEESLQKGKPASATAHQQKPIKGKPVVESRAIDPCAIARAVGQVLREKLGLHQGLCASKLNQHPEQPQAPAEGHSHHHRVLSSSEQRRVLKDTAYSHQASPKDHSYLNKSRHTTGRGDKLAFPPRELESPVRRCQHGPRVAGDSGHLRHHPTCPQKCVPSGQPECASHAFPGRKVVPKTVQFMERKPASSHVNRSSMC